MPTTSAKRDRSRLPVAVTMGEPAGIGGEIALKAWLHRRERGLAPFFMIDDPARLAGLAEELGLAAAVGEIADPGQAAELFPTVLPVLPRRLTMAAVPGRPDPANAAAVIAAIDAAAALAAAGAIAGRVTCPIQKSSLYAAGFRFPGHTEYLGALAGRLWPDDPPCDPVMMLAVPGLRVVPVTVHVPLSQVAQCLTRDAIVHAARVTAAVLIRDFGIDEPRLAVSGLNPHAGEGGAMGREEIEIITPAIETLRGEGIDASGPHSPDTMFHEAARARYDAAICMYHDQALIPLKTLDFERGVNITLGLPFVRTSPDHGTALDIAGKGKASPESLIAAIATAHAMAAQRERAA
jgi:4-hydroxythreonine-4-phosphate dehydrogenase